MRVFELHYSKTYNGDINPATGQPMRLIGGYTAKSEMLFKVEAEFLAIFGQKILDEDFERDIVKEDYEVTGDPTKPGLYRFVSLVDNDKDIRIELRLIVVDK